MQLSQILNKSEFHKNVLTLISGTAIAQLIPVIFSPLLSRIFTVSDFSLFGIFMSIVTITSVFATVKYDYAIVLSKNDEEAFYILSLSFVIAILFTIFIFLFLIILKEKILYLLNNPDFADWLYLIPISVFAVVSLRILNYWFTRERKYKILAINKVVKNSSIIGSNIIIGLSQITNGGLIIGQIFGTGIASLILGRGLLTNSVLIYRSFSKKKLKQLVVQYKDFPLFALPNTLLSTFSREMPILFISSWFTNEMVGTYFFARKILSIPMAFIGSSVAQTFYQEFTDIVNSEGNAIKFLTQTWLLLFIVGFIPLLLLFFFGEIIFSFIFGDEWILAGKIASILSPLILLNFISSPTSTTYIVLRKQHIGLIFSLSSTIYRPLAIYTGYIYSDFYLGVQLLVILDAIQIIIYNIVILRKLGK
jgi:O-antigen/teichoic acid export membrane protein